MADLYARAPQAEAAGGQFFLSVHHDSVRAEYQQTWIVDGKEQRYSEYARGFSLFVSRKNPRLAKSLACASAIGAARVRRNGVGGSVTYPSRETRDTPARR